MLLAVIIAILLFGNWFFNQILVSLPVAWGASLSTWGFWLLVIFGVSFLGWCIGED